MLSVIVLSVIMLNGMAQKKNKLNEKNNVP
jgi:hypothetical protein